MKKVIFIYILTVAACLCKPTDTQSGQPAQPAVPAQPQQPIQKADSNAKEEAPKVPADHVIIVPQNVPAQKAGAVLPEHAEKDATVSPSVAPPAPITTKPNETPKTNDTTTETPKKHDTEPPKGKDDKPTTAKPTPVPSSSSTTTMKATTVPANVKPTEAPATNQPLKARGFDGGSFVGGIILTLGLLAIGFMGFKYYKNQTERNYHTL